MSNRSNVLHVPGRPRPTLVSTNKVTFGNKCPMAEDSPDFIENGDTVLDSPPEANISDISSSSVDSILDQTETHYIHKITNDSVMSMAIPVFEASFVRAQNGPWSQTIANIMNQLFFLQAVNAFASDCFFNAESVHFTDTAKYVDPTSYADAMSRSDARLWQEAFQPRLSTATFVDDVHHCTNDLAMYRSFRKRFEKKFDVKSDDHFDVYLGNRIVQDRAKGTVTMSQEHNLMACLEKFGLRDCNGVDKPIASRLTVQDQPELARKCPTPLRRSITVAWLAVSSILLRGLVLTLPLRSLSCLVLSLTLANHTWKQPNACFDTSRRR